MDSHNISGANFFGFSLYILTMKPFVSEVRKTMDYTSTHFSSDYCAFCDARNNMCSYTKLGHSYELVICNNMKFEAPKGLVLHNFTINDMVADSMCMYFRRRG